MILNQNFTILDALYFLCNFRIVKKYVLRNCNVKHTSRERRIFMTRNQMDVVTQLENRRHYLATEAETYRHDIEMERENKRTNQENERIRWDANAANRYAADKKAEGTVTSAAIGAGASMTNTEKQIASNERNTDVKIAADKLIASWNNTIKNRELNIKSFAAHSQAKLNDANAEVARNQAERLHNEVVNQGRMIETQLKQIESQKQLNDALRSQADANAMYTQFKKTYDSLNLVEKTLNDISSRGLDWYKTSSNSKNQLFHDLTTLYNTYLSNKYDMEGLISSWEE